ncbi:hypothetical protein GF380_02640 [Candidatus Uhrbacteria bacterium]|nr:hypothetical protein [Candidatus Uhrbacteria bacterium]
MIGKLIGAAGLVLITAGVLSKKRERQDTLFIFGGVCLEIYSIAIGDWIFILLQLVFIAASAYSLYQAHVSKTQKPHGRNDS